MTDEEKMQIAALLRQPQGEVQPRIRPPMGQYQVPQGTTPEQFIGQSIPAPVMQQIPMTPATPFDPNGAVPVVSDQQRKEMIRKMMQQQGYGS